MDFMVFLHLGVLWIMDHYTVLHFVAIYWSNIYCWITSSSTTIKMLKCIMCVQFVKQFGINNFDTKSGHQFDIYTYNRRW
jgi:hypothetical protein